MGEAGDFSRRVIDQIDRAIGMDGRATAEIHAAAGMSKNYFYKRMRGELPFNTNDVEKLADVLGIDPFKLMFASEAPDNVSYLGRVQPPTRKAADKKPRKADQAPHAD